MVPKPPMHRRNKIADEWAKLVVDEPDAHGAEWFSFTQPSQEETRALPSPSSLANVKCGFSEKKWAEAQDWAKKRPSKTKNRKHRPAGSRGRSPAVVRANKRLASRFYRLKTYGTVSSMDHATPRRLVLMVQYKIQTREHLFKNCPQWKRQQKTRPGGDQKKLMHIHRSHDQQWSNTKSMKQKRQ